MEDIEDVSTPPPTTHFPARSSWALEIAVPNVPTAISTAQCGRLRYSRKRFEDYYGYH